MDSGTAPGDSAEGKGTRWEDKFNSAGSRIEEELRRVVRYLDEEVVPEIRRNGSTALRYASAELDRLARLMDDHRDGGPDAKP